MANSVGVRTAAGGVLSLEITPADVIGRCDRCRRMFREGDWYCEHLADRYDHQVARLEDQSEDAPPAVAAERAAPHAVRLVPAAFVVSFEGPPA